MSNETTKPSATLALKERPFGTPGEENSYAVFPEELENNPEVFFHGTAESALQSIHDDGFQFPAPPRAPSVSFSRTSGLSLGYACDRRTEASPNGCVIAVRFGPDNRSAFRSEHFGIHVDRFDPQPEIVGYCIVPADYDPRR